MKILIASLALVVVAGCGRKPPEETAAPAPAKAAASVSVEAADAPPPPPPADAVAAPSADSPPPDGTALNLASGVAGGLPGEPANPAEVKAAMDRFFDSVGNFPNNWQEMISRKFIPRVPLGKNGKPLDFRECVVFLTRPMPTKDESSKP